MQTIDVTPTWSSLMNAMFAILQSGTPEGKKEVESEIRRLAKGMDELNAMAKASPVAQKIMTGRELKEFALSLSDDDQIVWEDSDPVTGDAGDLFSCTVDVIEGIELTDGSQVREIRFCRIPHGEEQAY